MTNVTITNAQHRVLEDAANFPESEIEKFTQHLPAGAQKSLIGALLKKECIEQRGDKHYITATGCNAVGREATPSNTPQQDSTPAEEPKRETKQSIIINLLSREEGTTLAELIDATGWKPHSVRGHLSNLRKKRGLPIETFTSGEGKHGYRLLPDQEAA
ncbi:MAG: DUF3489 domain-containing protein [Alphaproteobacteria bacterium]|nr:DUF3489 domain-containing protein [Alphaproteobacteria bacterium]